MAGDNGMGFGKKGQLPNFGAMEAAPAGYVAGMGRGFGLHFRKCQFAVLSI